MPECQACKVKGVFKDPLPGQTKLFHCSRCKVMLYCSEECQKENWKWHKTVCKQYGRKRLEEVARGEASLGEREATTEKSPVTHYLMIKGGNKVNLMEGENWFNMVHGVFFEPTDIDNHNPLNSDTRVCLDVDGPHCAIKNHSQDSKVSLARDASSSFEAVPRLQMRILRPNDSIHVRCEESPDGFFGVVQKEITLKYCQQTS